MRRNPVRDANIRDVCKCRSVSVATAVTSQRTYKAALRVALFSRNAMLTIAICIPVYTAAVAARLPLLKCNVPSFPPLGAISGR